MRNNADTVEREGKYVQSVERALNIMEAMAREGAPVTVTELAEKVGLKISTVHRLLSTLAHRGYVEQDPEDNKYRLGLKLLEVEPALYFSDIRTVARPYLEELVDICNETANLAILDKTDVVYIDQLNQRTLLSLKCWPRSANRGRCTYSFRKALLAFLPEEKLEEILNQMELTRFTNETITDVKHLKKSWWIRNEGYAPDWGERRACQVHSRPIFNHEGKVIANSISATSSDNHLLYGNELVDIIKGIAAKISHKMGYNGNGANRLD